VVSRRALQAALGLTVALALLAAAAPAPNFLVRAFSSTSTQNQKPAYQAAIPLPAELQDAYDFWVRVYTEWTSEQAFLHRDRSYEVRADELGRAELYDTKTAFVKEYSNHKLLAAAKAAKKSEYWRMQRGMSDLVLTAVQTFHFFRDPMEEAIAPLGAPRDLLALGFLESLYNPYARSHTGALGVFQIQPWEGYKLGARMGPAYNELLDPISSARLAVRKLLSDRETIRETAAAAGAASAGRTLWPLALIAYNQGIQTVLDSVKERRSVNHVALVFDDRSGRFGFAGRNFYIQYRLWADLLRNLRPGLDRSEWPAIEESVDMEVGAYLSWPELVKGCKLSPGRLKPLNLAITDLGWEGVLRLPPEAVIRLPREELERVNACLRGPGGAALHQEQLELAAYKVQRGETLTSIAEKLGCSPFDLMQVNGIDREAASRLPVGALVQVPTRRYAELGTRARAIKAKGKPKPKAFFPHLLQRGDTPASLQKRFGLKDPELSKWNDLKAWKAGQTVHIPRYD